MLFLKKNIRVGICIGFLLMQLPLFVKAQQEPMYSQYMFNMVHINPAYAGNRAVDNFTALYRNQWTGIKGAPRTFTLTWDRRLDDSNVGYGVQIYNDRLGIENTSGVQGFYSYRIPFNNSFFSFGLSAGFLNYRASFSEVETAQGGDPLFMENVSTLLPTVGLGFLYANDKWYAGLSIPALLRTKTNSINQWVATGANNHYFLTGGYLFNIAEGFKLKPSFLMKAVAGSAFQYDLNMNLWVHDNIGIGLSYRTKDALIGMFEVQLSPELRLGYAYDYTLSNLKTYSKGSHEIMLRYELGISKKKKILSPRYY